MCQDIKNAGKHCLEQVLPLFFFFPVKGHIVNILELVGHVVSVSMTQCHSCRAKVVTIGKQKDMTVFQ